MVANQGYLLRKRVDLGTALLTRQVDAEHPGLGHSRGGDGVILVVGRHGDNTDAGYFRVGH